MSNSKLMEQICDFRAKIAMYYTKIDLLKSEIHNLETKLYNSCVHVWIIDSTVCSEHTVYVCKKCGLGNYY